MDSTVPISVLVGKAVLTQRGLYVNDRKTILQDSSQFQAFVMTTQAIIVDELSTVFADDFGQLIKDGYERHLIAPGLAPWDQYAQSSLMLSSNAESAEIVIGWCALLHLVSLFSTKISIDPRAALVAKYIVTEAGRAGYVDRVELDAWLAWDASRNPFASDLEQISHDALKPVNPFERGQPSVCVPWIEQLGKFSAFDALEALNSDISVSIPLQSASLQVGGSSVYGHFEGLDLIPKDPPGTDFMLAVDHKGDQMMFRARADKNRAVLRLQSKSAISIKQGAFQ